ncbi:filamentous hemagglutinin outer membrane protein [Haemophilus pittmaniae]|uniref:Filamentous hemagglutinin outer membrane protein n=1 Tax=Haemophilus pittmaniae TaxID=249188 RepID=A0A377J157_9PAST|nr:VENN motif pre-toxin domain-containing protein [Haemophilus pittmaniae]STO94099.1 filamentous hemagglutinin outer membrane protein [Haemophilus pittmaniae]
MNKQLDEQRQIREAAGHIQTAVNKYIDVQQKAIAKEIKVLQSQKEAAEARGDSAQANALDEQILNARIRQDQWGTGGEYKRATDALTQAVLMGVSGGSAQAIAAAGASPYVNQVIKDVTKDIPSLNLPAHVIWGAIEAELTGGHATTGAISTAAGELGAAYLAEHIFGKKAAELSPEERSKVRDAAKAIAGIAGGLSSAMQGQDLVNSLNDTSVGLTVANNAVENNFLSDASRARLNALKAKYSRGEKLTNKEKLEFRDLIQSDQRSDVLLDKFRKDPNSLNSDERKEFLSYVERYYIETVTGNTASGYKLASSTSPVNAKNRFESEYLINDPVPKRDYGHFPFAGTDAHRSQAVNTLPEESKNWLGWRSEKPSRDEEMYHTIKNELDALENYKNSANGKIAYSVKDGLEAGSLLALGGVTGVVRGVALVEEATATVGGKALTLVSKGEQALRLSEDLATKAYINGQLSYVNLVDKGIKAYSTASTKAANAYINGQLAYADAVEKGINISKVAAREGIERTRELVSQGIYYSYNPTQAKVVQTAVQGIEHGLKPITQMTTNQYVKQAAIGTGFGAAAQYSVNGEINYNDAIKTGFMTPYTLNAPIGMAVLIGSIDTAISAASDSKSQIKEQTKYAGTTGISYGVEKLTPTPLKPVASYIGLAAGEFVNKLLNSENKEGEK